MKYRILSINTNNKAERDYDKLVNMDAILSIVAKILNKSLIFSN